jgi:hypothetical protein
MPEDFDSKERSSMEKADSGLRCARRRNDKRKSRDFCGALRVKLLTAEIAENGRGGRTGFDRPRRLLAGGFAPRH